MEGCLVRLRAAPLAVAVSAALSAGSCGLADQAGEAPGQGGKADEFGCSERLKLEPAFTDLSFEEPVALVQNPQNELRFYVVERTGRIWTFLDLSGGASARRAFADLRDRVEAGPGEAGLLGLAFHPRFVDTGEVFVSYTAAAPASPSGLVSRVSRFSSENGRQLDLASEEVLLQITQPHENHNGGHVAFGPDGFLYVGFGDGGGAGDPGRNGQDRTSLLGKILRIDVDRADPARGTPYAIPTGNPLAEGGGAPEIFALGLRNPWRFSFDRQTGSLWVGDVGQDSFEEIDRVEAGGNYGWPIREGAHCFGAPICEPQGLVDPLTEYGRDGGVSVTGGFVYRGSDVPDLEGEYVFADFGSGKFFSVAADRGDGLRPPELLLDTALAPSSFAEDLRGELYVLDFAAGRIHRLAAGGPCGGDPIGPQDDFSGGPADFQALYDELLSVRCAPCHTVRGFGGLSMTTADVGFEELLNAPAETEDCAGRTRVVPGDPGASLLFSKVSGVDLCGPKMPEGGELSAAEIETIRAWIEAGAPR